MLPESFSSPMFNDNSVAALPNAARGTLCRASVSGEAAALRCYRDILKDEFG